MTGEMRQMLSDYETRVRSDERRVIAKALDTMSRKQKGDARAALQQAARAVRGGGRK
jgi:hypothetical protein